jgi:tRNA G26 N,N-dimethylase Trm1
MNPQSNSGTNKTSFVVCSCQNCTGKIEFETSGLEPEEIRAIDCPHCGKKTEVFDPKYEGKIAIKKLLVALYQDARNAFFGEIRRQDFTEAYQWIYLAENISSRSGIQIPMSESDADELNSIKNHLAELLSELQIRHAHLMADKAFESLILSSQS